MTPLMEQFILEARDFLQDIGENLIALEASPDDQARIDDLFRVAHTLKGNSGLFEFPAMTGLLHAAEDVLDAVRHHKISFSTGMADDLLDAMDRVGAMVDQIETDAALDAAATEGAEAILTRLRAWLPQEDDDTPSPTANVTDYALALPADWLAQQQAEAGDKPLQRVEYRPEAGCYFKGEDPLFLVRNIPGIRWCRARSAQPLPSLTDLDCFEHQLIFEAICQEELATIQEHFRYVPEQVTIASLTTTTGASVDLSADPDHQQPGAEDQSWLERLAQTQYQILDWLQTQPWHPGYVQACVSTLTACYFHHDPESEIIADAAAAAMSTESVAPLLSALHSSALLGSLALAEVAPAAQAEAPIVVEADQPDAAKPSKAASGKRVTDSKAEGMNARKVLKVDQVKIDHLMNLIGEMVVAKNALPYLANKAEAEFNCRELSKEIKAQYSVINRIAEEMQDAIMQVRMMPVSFIFQRFPRLVRDLSQQLGKQVELVVEGEATEADKNIIEALSDPLIHIVRNSLDHGLETPEQREAAGKPIAGKLTIRATQASERVLIEISDDGRGMDPDVIRHKAYEKSLITEEQLESLSPEEALQLVFLPGFSTAATISNLSGRGVGMDVVRTAIEKVGGQAELRSQLGQGTHLSLSLPLSMAVTNVMIIETDHQIFGVPMDMVVETVRLHKDRIRAIKQQRTTVLRGRITPVIPLNDLLVIDTPPQPNEEEEYAALVVRVGQDNVALLVDSFSEVVDVILKPMPGEMGKLSLYAGTALLGDGSVLMVLNPRELLK